MEKKFQVFAWTGDGVEQFVKAFSTYRQVKAFTQKHSQIGTAKVEKWTIRKATECSFSIVNIRRDSVRMLFGETIVEKLSDDDLSWIAEEMAERYVPEGFVNDLRDILIEKFDDRFSKEEIEKAEQQANE